MNEAYFGLIKAVENFNPDQGALFSTYATPLIRQSVKSFLDKCGKVIRIPVHKQTEIYRYNQMTAHYLQNFNREPTIQEYAQWLYISDNAVIQLQCFMFQENIKSLDAPVTGGEDENMNYTDTVACDTDLEGEVVEKVGGEQLHDLLWEMINQALKNERMTDILRYRFVNGFTLEEIGEILNITRQAVRQSESAAFMHLRRNRKIRQLVTELGIWDADKPFSANRVKLWCECERYSALDKKELQYAVRMGWVETTP